MDVLQPPASTSLLRLGFDDFDALVETVQGWGLDWVQLDRGPLQAEVMQVVCAGAQLTRSRFNRQFLQRGSPPHGLRTFGLLDEGVAGVSWCRAAVTDQQLLAFDPTSDYEAISMPGFGCTTISLDEELLAGVAWDLGIRDLDSRLPGSGSPLGCPESGREALRIRVSALFDRLQTAPGFAVDRIVRRDIESELPTLILDLISPITEPATPPPLRRRSEALQLGRAYIEEYAAEAPTIREVCRAAGVSWRTLDYAFREYFGVSPKAYLQAVRLRGFRRDLRRIEPGITISHVAGEWGFWHMGQLAADYRRQFGEFPSETLRRSG